MLDAYVSVEAVHLVLEFSPQVYQKNHYNVLLGRGVLWFRIAYIMYPPDGPLHGSN